MHRPTHCAVVASLLQLGCGAPPQPEPVPPAPSGEPAPAPRAPAPTRAELFASGQFLWQPAIASPRALARAEHPLQPLLESCEQGDAALTAVARRLAHGHAAGRSPMEAPEITFALRAAGAPYVWPRAWVLAGAAFDLDDTRERFQSFLASFHDGGDRRCGLAQTVDRTGERVIAAVVVDALADLSPFPTTARLGQWLELTATLRVPADEAKVIVLAPRGPPRTVVTSLSGSRVRARFPVDQRGPWVVQLLAAADSGPRPFLEAMVFVEEPPPASYHSRPAPGEDAAVGATTDTEALGRMIDASRRSEGLPLLRRHPALDQVAQEHADAMRAAGRVAHDLGEGDPRLRLERVGLLLDAAGENLAHAPTLKRAHRVIWASPSHRDTLLHPRFDAFGVGVAREDNGSVWACEVFVRFQRDEIGRPVNLTPDRARPSAGGGTSGTTFGFQSQAGSE